MPKEQKLVYEPHPVSAERKAELRSQGYTILDAIYAPKDEAPKDVSPEDIDNMKRADVVRMLEEHGVERPTGKVDDLRRWLKEVMA